MRTNQNKRWALVGGAFGAGIAAVAVSAAALFVGTGTAASNVKPENTDPPTISGTAQDGQRLTADRGTWTNNPTGYEYAWLRCDKNGGSDHGRPANSLTAMNRDAFPRLDRVDDSARELRYRLVERGHPTVWNRKRSEFDSAGGGSSSFVLQNQLRYLSRFEE